MALEESIQQDVMSAIQILMSSTTLNSPNNSTTKSPGKFSIGSPFANGAGSNGGFEDSHMIDRQLKEAWDEVHRLTLENEELSQKYHDIQQKIDYVSEEKDYLITQMDAAGIQHKATRSSPSGGASSDPRGGSGASENDVLNIST